jgi:ABC-type Fe3+ transport system permease subunit
MKRRLAPILRSDTLLIGLAIAVVAYLTVIPLVMLLYGSFKNSPPGVAGAFTLANYANLLKGSEMIIAFQNSAIFSLGSSLLAFVGGVCLAWMTERSNMPLKKVVYAFVLVPLIVPGLLTTIGWIYVITHSFRELSTSIMLYRSGTEVLSVVIFELWDSGQYPELSALGMTMVVVLVAISLLARWIGTKFAVQPL